MSSEEVKGLISGRDLLTIRLFSGPKKDDIGPENTYFWDINS
jgi:hypothetical protein